jgi:hypothetical protein
MSEPRLNNMKGISERVKTLLGDGFEVESARAIFDSHCEVQLRPVAFQRLRCPIRNCSIQSVRHFESRSAKFQMKSGLCKCTVQKDSRSEIVKQRNRSRGTKDIWGVLILNHRTYDHLLRATFAVLKCLHTSRRTRCVRNWTLVAVMVSILAHPLLQICRTPECMQSFPGWRPRLASWHPSTVWLGLPASQLTSKVSASKTKNSQQ